MHRKRPSRRKYKIQTKISTSTQHKKPAEAQNLYFHIPRQRCKLVRDVKVLKYAKPGSHHHLLKIDLKTVNFRKLVRETMENNQKIRCYKHKDPECRAKY